MGMIVLNSFLIVVCALSGFYIGFDIFRSTPYAIVGALICLIISLLVIFFEKYVRKSPPRVILGGVIGLLLSLIIANFFIKAVFFNYITYKNSFFMNKFLLFCLFFAFLFFFGIFINLHH